MLYRIETEEVCTRQYWVEAHSEHAARKRFEEGDITVPAFDETRDVEIVEVLTVDAVAGGT